MSPKQPVQEAPDQVESAVLARYADAAVRPEAALCCPVQQADPALADFLPAEIVEIDYGCGDPTAWALPGDAVLDLGSGSGKACYLIARRVGPEGRVIGVDMNDAMLSLARKHEATVAERLGYRNVRFVKARIQDLALDIERVESTLRSGPISSLADLVHFEGECARWRREEPLIPHESHDLVVSNCVLNLVRPQDKERLFHEIHRVLRRGGRAVISDIVCDEDPTPVMKADPELWSGCIAGAFREEALLAAFERAGFYGIELLARSDSPWRVVQGIEFRSVTVRAFKGKEGPCLERNQAVVYRGPWRSVQDDDGHSFPRGRRIAVCDKTFRLMTDAKGPYAAHMSAVLPATEVPVEGAAPFTCSGTRERHPRETKGEGYRESRETCSNSSCC